MSFVATRVEVYGLFLAAVLLGGGTAVAMTNDSTTEVQPIATAEATQTPLAAEPTTPEQQADPTYGDGPVHSVPTEIVNGVEMPVGSPPVYPVPAPDPVKIAEPFIGDAASVFYEGRNHICGWDYQALGGWGWGFDPNSPCNDDFVNYIATHCSANDGVVYPQRCNEWSTGTLPVAN